MTEYAACLAQGGCLLTTRREVQVGSLFRFEMECQELRERLDLEGEVIRVRPIRGSTVSYELAVQYRSREAERALEDLLARVGTDETQAHQLVRRHPRITVNLPVEDSQGLGRRYLVRDVSQGGFRMELMGELDTAVGARVLLGVRFGLHEKLAFLPGTVVWHRATADVLRSHLGVRFDEAAALSEGQQRALLELLRLRRPSQAYMHLVEPMLRHTRRVTMSAGSQPVTPQELGAIVTEVARSELPVTLGMALVGSDLSDLDPSGSCEARVGLAGDVQGELRVRASLELCTAIAAQFAGEVLALDDRETLVDALRELVITLAGALCDRLAARGHDVWMVSRPGDDGASPGLERACSVSLAGMRGLAAIGIYVPASARARAA